MHNMSGKLAVSKTSLQHSCMHMYGLIWIYLFLCMNICMCSEMWVEELWKLQVCRQNCFSCRTTLCPLPFNLSKIVVSAKTAFSVYFTQFSPYCSYIFSKFKCYLVHYMFGTLQNVMNLLTHSRFLLLKLCKSCMHFSCQNNSCLNANLQAVVDMWQNLASLRPPASWECTMRKQTAHGTLQHLQDKSSYSGKHSYIP
jgi:hypothetical protein